MTPLVELGLLFARLSLLAVGGGLGILPEMERQAVAVHGWVTHKEFLDAFALAQLTPGPGMLMVLVLGLRAAGPTGALAAGLGTFAPSAALTALVSDRWQRFGAWPLMDALRDTLAPVALGLLSAGCYTLVRIGVDDWAAAALAVGALAAVGWRRWSPALVIALGAAAGLALPR